MSFIPVIIVILVISPVVPGTIESPIQPVRLSGQPTQPIAYLTTLKSPLCWVSGVGFTYVEGQVFSFATIQGNLFEACNPLFV